MRKLRTRKTGSSAQGLINSKWQNLGLNLSPLILRPSLFSLHHLSGIWDVISMGLPSPSNNNQYIFRTSRFAKPFYTVFHFCLPAAFWGRRQIELLFTFYVWWDWWRLNDLPNHTASIYQKENLNPDFPNPKPMTLLVSIKPPPIPICYLSNRGFNKLL